MSITQVSTLVNVGAGDEGGGLEENELSDEIPFPLPECLPKYFRKFCTSQPICLDTSILRCPQVAWFNYNVRFIPHYVVARLNFIVDYLLSHE